MLGKEPYKITFFDYGFGYGRWARVAAAIGAKVFATEISPEKIEFARSIGIEIIPPHALKEMRFDVIHAEQIFEHLVEPRADFLMLANALTADGVLKVGVPRPGRIRELVKQKGMIAHSPFAPLAQNSDAGAKPAEPEYISILPLEHLNAYSEKSLDVLGQNAGLRVASARRKRFIPFYLEDPRDFARSSVKAAKEVLKAASHRAEGYRLYMRQS
jgi:SAM-dependent methyltransferase